MTRKNLYLCAASLLLIGILAIAWWGWSEIGLAALQLGLGIC